MRLLSETENFRNGNSADSTGLLSQMDVIRDTTPHLRSTQRMDDEIPEPVFVRRGIGIRDAGTDKGVSPFRIRALFTRGSNYPCVGSCHA